MAKQPNKIKQQINNDSLLGIIAVQVLKPKLYNFPDPDSANKHKRNRSVIRSKPNPESSIKARHRNEFNWKPLFLLQNKIVDFKLQVHHKPKKLSINQQFETMPTSISRNCFRGLKYKSQISQKKRPFTGNKSFTRNISSIRSVQEKRPPQRNFSTISFDEEEKIKEKQLQKGKKFSVNETYLSYRKRNKKRTMETEIEKKLQKVESFGTNSWSQTAQ